MRKINLPGATIVSPYPYLPLLNGTDFESASIPLAIGRTLLLLPDLAEFLRAMSDFVVRYVPVCRQSQRLARIVRRWFSSDTECGVITNAGDLPRRPPGSIIKREKGTCNMLVGAPTSLWFCGYLRHSITTGVC